MTAYGYPAVMTAEALPGFRLLLKYENEEIRIFDAKPMLTGKENTWLGELLNPSYFAKVYVNSSSETVEWPNGQDLCPDCLYEDSYALCISAQL